MDDILINFQSPPDDEDTLSLRDFPVTPLNMLQLQENHRRSSSQPSSEFFEFFTDFANSEKFMSHAEDIIFCGKLVPFKQNYHEEKHQMPLKEGKIRRRSESMSELKSANNSAPHVMRTSRSLDDNKLTRNTKMNIDGMNQTESIHHTNSVKFKVPKPPRWLVLMFGAFKFPSTEMDLRDIKSRQVRRTGLTTSFVARDMMPVNRSDHRKSSWTVLDVLGCQGSRSVAVTASLSCGLKA